MRQSITFYKNPEDILKNKKLSGSKNTWDDWHIIPSSRPVFAPPQFKSTYIDIPGGNGSLDLSEALTKFPLHENRSGSFTFKVMNHYEKNGETIYESADKGRWADRYSEMMEFLHGRHLYAVLDDDSKWFYEGRFTVNEWRSEPTWSEIEIGYNVNPFKWSIYSSTSDWFWDPFNFDKDVIRDAACSDILVNSEDYQQYYLPTVETKYDSLLDIPILSYCDLKEFFGNVPVSPTITVTRAGAVPTTGDSVDIRLVNSYLGIDITRHISAGTTEFVPDFIFYGQNTPYEIYMKGHGKVSIDFRVGRL